MNNIDPSMEEALSDPEGWQQRIIDGRDAYIHRNQSILYPVDYECRSILSNGVKMNFEQPIILLKDKIPTLRKVKEILHHTTTEQAKKRKKEAIKIICGFLSEENATPGSHWNVYPVEHQDAQYTAENWNPTEKAWKNLRFPPPLDMILNDIGFGSNLFEKQYHTYSILYDLTVWIPSSTHEILACIDTWKTIEG